MGGIHVKSVPIPIPQTENGYVLSNIYLPEEVLAQILSYVDKVSLVKTCPLVCKTWYHVIRNEVWKLKAEREHLRKLVTLPSYRRLSYIIYRDVLRDKPFGRNLLKDGSREQDFQYWIITENVDHHRIVETPPIGVEVPPKMGQKIDLVAEGIDCEFLDRYQPNIYISDRYSALWGCGIEYYLNVYLLDSNMKIKMDFGFVEAQRDWARGWNEVKRVFSNYGSGIRYIVFDHGEYNVKRCIEHYSELTDGIVTCPFADLKHTNSDYQKNVKSIMSNKS